MNRSVVVVGAGISGLTAAWWLHKAGVHVTVLEKDRVAGGTMRTRIEDGWLVETGPNSALETTPLFGEMFTELGIMEDRLYPDSKAERRYIVRNAALHPLPTSPGSFLKTRLWTLGSKLRLLKEPFIGRAEREETIAEFVERRLGREFLDYAINPFVAGVYAGNPEQLSVRMAFPKLYALEEKYGGLIRGMIGGARDRKKRAEKAKDRAKMFSFQNGMQTFPEAIVRQLGDSVNTGCDVIRISREVANGTITVEFKKEGISSRIEAGGVIVAVPAFVASRLVDHLDSSLAAMLDAVYYPPVAEVFLGFRETQVGLPLDGFGYLVPAVEKRSILGTIWSSALFPNRAPAGHVALTTFVGGSRQPELASRDEGALTQLVLGELRDLMQVSGQPAFARVIRWDRAIPQYNLGYRKVIDSIENFEKRFAGIHLYANYRGGIAVGDCVMSGRKAADAVLAQIGSFSVRPERVVQ